MAKFGVHPPSTIIGVRHGLGSLGLYGDLAMVCLRGDTEASSMAFEKEILYPSTYTTVTCQVDDVETTFCSLAFLYESGTDLDIPKAAGEADLNGPKSRSLTSALSGTLPIVGYGVICRLRSALWYWTVIPHAISCFFHKRRGDGLGRGDKRCRQTSAGGDPPLAPCLFICGETRAKLLVSAESVVLRSLAASTLVWSTRARHSPSLRAHEVAAGL
jgi:hypothetical protein